ncbi:unnamed protein product [Closterium sp. NIES-53]
MAKDDGFRHSYLRTAPNVTIHFVEAGPPTGQLVVLLHGFPEFWNTWHKQIGPLAEAGFRVVVPDLRGFGDSTRPAGVAAYSRQHVCADVASLISHCLSRATDAAPTSAGDVATANRSRSSSSSAAAGDCRTSRVTALGENGLRQRSSDRGDDGRKADLIGHGWGAFTAWAMAMDHAHLVRRVAVLCGPHPLVFHNCLSLWEPLTLLRYFYWFLFLVPLLPEWLLRRNNCAALQRVYHDEPLQPLSPALVHSHVEAFSTNGALTAGISYHRAFLRGLWRFGRPVPVPHRVLVLWAGKDKYARPHMAQPPPALVPNAQVVHFPELTYWMMWDDPNQVNDSLISFLSSKVTVRATLFGRDDPPDNPPDNPTDDLHGGSPDDASGDQRRRRAEMRVKRQREVRRHVRFYRTSCGFREPFKAVADGTFLHHVTRLRLSPLATSLPKLLGFPTRVYITRCILAELQRLGDAFKDTRFAARQLEVARCSHEGEEAVTASQCIQHLVAGGNHQHFFVASQDIEFKKLLKKVPAVPIISANGTSISLEPPSPLDLSLSKKSESARLGLPEHEQQQLLLARAAKRKKRIEETQKGLVATVVDRGLARQQGSVAGSEKEAATGGETGGEGEGVAGSEREGSGGADGAGAEEGGGEAGGVHLNADAYGYGYDSEEEGEERKPEWKRLGYVKDRAKFKRKRVKVRVWVRMCMEMGMGVRVRVQDEESIYFTVPTLSLSLPSHCPCPLTVPALSLSLPSHCPCPLTVPALSLSLPSHYPCPLTIPALSLSLPFHFHYPCPLTLTVPALSLSLSLPSHSHCPCSRTFTFCDSHPTRTQLPASIRPEALHWP